MSVTTAFAAGLWTSLPDPLTEWILDVLSALGYSQMTPVQASTIPLFMKHKDVVVEAVTGSGKTLAFVIPILEKLIRRETRLKKDEIGALVISPTRELASQIHSIFSLFLTSAPRTPDFSYAEPLLLVSSDHSSPAHDLKRFVSTGADIVIGTPGRIEEFLLGKGRGFVNVKELEVLVLDESDRLLDLGFHNTLTKIITHLPKQRRTGLFSATMTDADGLSQLVRVGLRNPARIVVKVQAKKRASSHVRQIIEERRVPANLQNFYIHCRLSEKVVQLIRLIKREAQEHNASHLIVYFATCACVDYFYKILPILMDGSFVFHSLHGNLTPSARTRTLGLFTSSPSSTPTPSILLTTDLAARGLDLPHVDTVIQFDPPVDTKTFSHRCGRTARAGRSGRAFVFLSGRELEFLDFLEVRKIPLKEQPYLANTTTVGQDGEDPDVPLFFIRIRKFLMGDRSFHDQSIKAFVSFVRAYSKHEASYIFRVKDLDLLAIARSFGLLRLPKMPELKNMNRDGWEDADIEWASFAYADAAQEARRLASAALESERLERSLDRSSQKKRNAAWSGKHKKKEEKAKKIEKKKLKARQLPVDTALGDPGGKRPHSDLQGAGDEDEDDWDELAREERMAKRLRKGDISKEQFDSEFAGLAE